VSQAIEAGRVEETISFARGDQSRLTYALTCEADLADTEVRHTPVEVVVAVPREVLRTWAEGEEVGIYATVDLGVRGTLSVSVEKDFACLHPSAGDDTDLFRNPKAGSSASDR
jgi:hypothetical protein